VFGAAALCIGLVVLVSCASTPPIVDAGGKPLPHSIASMEDIELGGIEQRVWFRARDRRAPVLIVLHGGPGAAEGALFRRFNAGLEDDFLVVHWEQRGTGRSYPPARDAPPTIGRLLDDLDELVRHVQVRFGARRIVLLGHSFGTVLGMLYARAHPDKVAAAVSVAQVVAPPVGDKLAYAYARRAAAARGDADATRRLQALGPPPHDVDQALELGRWLEKFGGVFHTRLSTGQLIWAALTTDEATLLDLVRFGQGNRFSLEALWPELLRLDLRTNHRFEVPVFFIAGRHDWRTPSVLAQDWWRSLQAPCKRWFWFERSAHNAPFEQPRAFVQLLRTEVAPVARGNVRCSGTITASVDGD
jgi:pimeloyl-ACP methyl ester carboxylesterase